MLRILAAVLLLIPGLAIAEGTRVPIDTASSTVKWKGSKMFAKDAHQGTIKLSDGFLMVDGDKITGGEFTIDMMSIQNTDLKDAGMKAKLEGHLQSADFFDTAKHSTAKYVITNVTPGRNGVVTFEGNATIRDKTEPLKITTRVKKEGKVMAANGNTDFDRTKYGVMYNSKGSFPDLVKVGKDKVINDKVDLEFSLKTQAM